jgi:hypothetical protein
LSLLPYAASAETAPWLIPRTQELARARKSEEFCTLYERRLTVFGDLAWFSTKGNSLTDVSLLQALNKMIVSSRQDVVATRQDAAFIEAQLKLHVTEAPRLGVLRSFYQTISDALADTTLSNMGRTSHAWQELRSQASSDPDLAYAVDLIDGFSDMAHTALHLTDFSDDGGYGAIALRLLCIQRILQQTRGNEVPILGYHDFETIVKHWTDLLTLQMCPSFARTSGEEG